MKRTFGWAAAALICVLLAIIGTYETVPTHNTDATHFDTLIVMGAPPDPNGQPSSEQRERVLKAVEEFRAGRASHIIFSGGAAHSKQAEAEVMAGVAIQAGMPADAVFIEAHSKNTIENVYFSNRLMEKHGWSSAEFVSSPSHLARTALILTHYKLQWSVQGSKWPPEYSWRRIGRYYVREVLGTAFFRWFGFPHSIFLPAA